MRTFEEKIIFVDSRTELDLQYPHYDGNEENEVIIPHGDLGFTEAPSMCIDETIRILMEMKQRGANRIYIADHCDHHGYYFYGVELTEI